jgi:3-oxoacyl-[acyl-carrier-protein] synthase-1
MSIYCDMNGEPYRADEYGFASLRVGEMYDSDCVCQTPADCLGDVGAASGVLFTVLASVAAYKGYSKGEILLVFCGSESGERSAVLLHMPLLDG